MLNFSDWLNERYAFDSEARNKEVEQKCLSYLQTFSIPTILDIGSGTGSNFLYLSSKIKQSQNWIFLEQEADLLQKSKERIKETLKLKGFELEETEGQLRFTKREQKIQLKTIQGSILEVDKLVNLKEVQLITAAAIFDLFSEEQYHDFAQQVHQYDLGILSTMNYTDMYFEPLNKEDEEFVSLYNAHMTRPRDFGKSMGKNCYGLIRDYYKAKNLSYAEGESPWLLHKEAKKMHEFLLQFMEGAIGEMKEKPDDLSKWIQQKQNESKEGEMVIVVKHVDQFVCP